MTSTSLFLSVEVDIASIVLNQPGKRNAMSQEMWAAFPDLIRSAEENPDVKCIIIHGGEAGAFCAGADISEFESLYSTPENTKASGERIQQALMAIESCSKPVIAAIEGACVGGGVSIAAAADLRVAGESARFAVTPAKLGLVYPVDDTRRLVALLGASATKDILMTGRLFEAEEALRLGLVNRLVPKGTAQAEAIAMAQSIGEVSQWSVRAVKRMVDGVASGWDAGNAEAEALFLEGFSNVDFQDGYKAFLEKRRPNFTFR